MMTKQEVFDKVKNHLLAQGERASDEVTGCCYRTDDGLKCAAGCLIDEAFYSSELEGTSVAREFGSTAACDRVLDALIKSGVGEDSFPLVRDLQDMHDNADVEAWSGWLGRAAARHGVSS